MESCYEGEDAAPRHLSDLPDRSLLIVDDDAVFCRRMASALENRGFVVEAATSVEAGLVSILKRPPAFAVIDMRLADGSGLEIMSQLRQKSQATRAIMLTGYGNLATTVTAIKLGAFDYLPKPADADEVYNALMAVRHDQAAVPERATSANRIRYDHIQGVYEHYGKNVSETARRLNMHRRTLQRLLAKRQPH